MPPATSKCPRHFVATALSYCRMLLYVPVTVCAVHIPCVGAGCGTPIYVVKCLQVGLASCNPGNSVSEGGLVQSHILPFYIKPARNTQVRRRRPLLGLLAGLYISLHGAHEMNYGPRRRATFGGITTCDALVDANLNPHGQRITF